MEHLACFAGGMFGLGGVELSEDKEANLQAGIGISEGCFEMYRGTRTGIAPESSDFSGGSFRVRDADNKQRPEAVESFFYMWRLTKDPKWREYGWKVFQAFENHTKVDSGYCGVANVNQIPTNKKDKMESFWLAETLKYLYLLFAEDELLDLNQWVFNTEAHPLKVRKGLDRDLHKLG